jgi:hypothetical protein
LAPLKHADERQECLLLGVDRKGPADGQGDAVDPLRMMVVRTTIPVRRSQGGLRMSQRFASCTCGRLQLGCHGEPSRVSICHCVDCQRRTGSVFGIAAFFDRGSVSVVQGASEDLHSRFGLREACDLPFLPRVWVNDLLGAGARTPPDRRCCRRIRRPLFPMAAAIRLDREQARLALSSGRHAGVRGHAAGARKIGVSPGSQRA